MAHEPTNWCGVYGDRSTAIPPSGVRKASQCSNIHALAVIHRAEALAASTICTASRWELRGEEKKKIQIYVWQIHYITVFTILPLTLSTRVNQEHVIVRSCAGFPSLDLA